MKYGYRALDGTNTKTRRLAYLTAVTVMLHPEGFSERQLLHRLAQWGKEHQRHLNNYWVQTGEITSTHPNSSGMRYLQLAMKMELIVPIAGVYRVTRTGSVLAALLRHYAINENPFVLNAVEKIFYTYHLLRTDADILLTITDSITRHNDISLNQLQRNFQDDFLRRIEQKISVIPDDTIKQYLIERRTEISIGWKVPERYAEHIVPPRLNWLLDIGMLDILMFKQHRYVLNPSAAMFLSNLPQLSDAQVYDVTTIWLSAAFWSSIACMLWDAQTLSDWEAVDEHEQVRLMTALLQDTFSSFRSTFVTKVSLSQALMYMCVRALLDHRIVVSPSQLQEWLSPSRVLNGRRYNVRFSSRENESYVLATAI